MLEEVARVLRVQQRGVGEDVDGHGGRGEIGEMMGVRSGNQVNGGGVDGRGEVWRRGSGWDDWDAASTRGFNSIFNIHDADFFIGT
ncbi:hypothetical protein VTI74DRAFT_8126 [Chaetomium olivicolor]